MSNGTQRVLEGHLGIKCTRALKHWRHSGNSWRLVHSKYLGSQALKEHLNTHALKVLGHLDT